MYVCVYVPICVCPEGLNSSSVSDSVGLVSLRSCAKAFYPTPLRPTPSQD